MRSAHTVAQVRAAEEARMSRLPEGALMAQAAAGLAAAVADLLGSAYGRRVLLLVGAGNNGGDALHAGALLSRRGAAVEAVLLAPDKAHAGGLAALRGAGGRVVSVAEAASPDVVVDGIVGIGATGPLRPDAAAAVAAFAEVPMVAVDVPSGVGVDSGEIDGAHVVADLTVTFGTHKVAQLVDPGARACGVVELVDLGLDLPPADVEALRAGDVAALLPVPDPDAQKYSRGVVGLRTGSTRYPGAAVLSVHGASCGFAGMVRYDGGALDEVRRAHPEVVGPGQVQAWVTGCGGGEDAASALEACLGDDVPVVVDADALLPCVELAPTTSSLVLTPHAGELARMVGVDRAQIEAAPLRHAREAAARFGQVVLLKGRRTLVAEPSGRVRANTTGVPWLATAGAGDVLAGLVGALLAAGLDPFDAASVGAWLHGSAARLAGAGGPVVAGDVAAALPVVVGDLLG
ncbi:bifunctional ADP-dependent NAD(P)H-hydrate dehydratase/NAD(P)H-hydrate epimerase [Nocardioides sp.]|uniref:bifunctional ADP-dependent NAD(P)H-hydrate dehydratase/NAD(P)H-hydrate epimerase n=1 Tax=Nocardioides sp. TaxID=35761 RepID=UPI003528CB31